MHNGRHLSMASKVSNICCSAYYHLFRIAKIRDSLATSVCTGCPLRDGLSTRYSSLCTRHSTKANQSTLPYRFTSTCHDEHFDRRAFACAGPTLWNKLPANIRGNGNHPQFKKLLENFFVTLNGHLLFILLLSLPLAPYYYYL